MPRSKWDRSDEQGRAIKQALIEIIRLQQTWGNNPPEEQVAAALARIRTLIEAAQ